MAEPGTCYKKILLAIFIILQKNDFGQKNFWISCTGSKVPFWQNWKIAKMALLNLCMKFKIFLAKSILLKHYENGNKKKYSQLVPGSAKSRIYSGKSTKRGFSKKGLTRIIFFSCLRFLWISRRPGTQNWEWVVFLPSKNLYRKCVLGLPITVSVNICNFKSVCSSK